MARHFLSMKLRLMRSSLRGSPAKLIALIFGLIFGVVFAVGGFLLFLGLSTHVGMAPAVGLFAGFIVAGWVFFPLVFFGVDETLDPARFALLPLTRRQLLTGMLAAACLGIPPLATLIATSGIALGATSLGGVPALVAVFGVVLGLATCVVASRAVTSGMASLLRSRRSRDIVMVLFGLVVMVLSIVPSLIGPALKSDTTASVAAGRALGVVFGWTPLAAPYVAAFDVAAGRPLLAVARFAITIATLGVLLWWWYRSLESAMVGTASAGTAKSKSGAKAGNGLIPAPVRVLLGNGITGAIAGRELRLWWRDPRRRQQLMSMGLLAMVWPVIMRFPGPPLLSGALVLTFAGSLLGYTAANQFGYDGGAYGSHLLAAVPGRTDLRARAIALAMIITPVVLVAAVVRAWVAGDFGLIPALIGAGLAGFGTALAVSSFMSVAVPYAMPDAKNPFKMPTGSGSTRVFTAFFEILLVVALATPVSVGGYFLYATSPVLGWLVLPLGIAYGLALAELSARLSGRRLEARGPEILATVTPRS